MSTNEHDIVNNPAHYTKHAIECIDIMESFSYPNLANAFKYIWRAGFKNNAEEDINKAKYYIRRHYEWLNDGDDLSCNPVVRDLQLKLLGVVKDTMEEERYGALEEIINANHGFSSERACIVDCTVLLGMLTKS